MASATVQEFLSSHTSPHPPSVPCTSTYPSQGPGPPLSLSTCPLGFLFFLLNTPGLLVEVENPFDGGTVEGVVLKVVYLRVVVVVVGLGVVVVVVVEVVVLLVVVVVVVLLVVGFGACVIGLTGFS